MPESSSPQPASILEKGPLYSQLLAKTSNTSEGGLETIIFEDMLARGWIAGDRHDYDRQHCVDLVKLKAFLEATQPKIAVQRNSIQTTPYAELF